MNNIKIKIKRTLSLPVKGTLFLKRLLLTTHCSLLITAATIIFSTPAAHAATLDIPIASSSDDAEQRVSNPGTMRLADTELDIINTGTQDQYVGLRFTNITVPYGATIDNAYVQFTSSNIDTSQADFVVQAEDIDNSPTFTGSNRNISNRTLTTSAVQWENVETWDKLNSTYQTPDISRVVQEVTNRANWTSGNAISLIISNSGIRRAHSYDSNPAYAPVLHIKWSWDHAIWPMTDSTNYLHDPDKIEFVNGYGQLKLSSVLIDDTVTDVYQYNNDKGSNPNIIHIDGNIYAIAHAGLGFDGTIQTIEIFPTGLIRRPYIDSFEYNTVKGDLPRIIHIAGNIYAIAHQGEGGGPADGQIKTVEILPDGTITKSVIDTFTFDTGFCRSTPYFIPVSGDIYAIVYTDADEQGQLITVEIDSTGNITPAEVDRLTFDTTWGWNPYIIPVFGNIYAIVYEGAADSGRLITVEIGTNGQITNTIVDSYIYDNVTALEPNMLHLSKDTFGIVYTGNQDKGVLITLYISTSGTITKSVRDSFIFDDIESKTAQMIHYQNETYVIAYDSNDAGYVIAVEISGNGDINKSILDKNAYFVDPSSKNQDIILYGDNLLAIPYEGPPNNNGFITTVGIGTAFRPDSPTIQPSILSVENFDTVTDFVTNEVLDGGSIMYQLTNDGYNPDPTWYYWDGANWGVATLGTHYNDAVTVDANIKQFGIDTGGGHFSFRAFLISDGSSFVRLDNVDLTFSYRPSDGLDTTILDLERFYESGENRVRIDYRIINPNVSDCNFSTATNQVQYSTSPSGPWADATIYGQTSNITCSNTGTIHNETFEPLYWDATGVQNGYYYIQVLPHDGNGYPSEYTMSTFPVRIFNPSAEDMMRHGKSFLDGVKQYFYFKGLTP